MKGRFVGLALAFALVAGLPTAALADEAAVEDEYVAEIATPGGFAYYSFTPDESGYYVIAASSDSDTYGYLYDADWNLIAENDDSVDSYDAQLIAYLEAGVVYYAAFGYYDSAETGSFTVSVETFDMATIAVDESVLVAVDSVEPYAYFSFTAEEAGSYTFFAEGAYDTFVYLYDADWNLVDYDDDSAGDYNAKINVALEAGETCYLVFCMYDSTESGEFAVVAQATETETIVLGDSYSVTIDGGEVLYCAIVPDETGVYDFYTTGDADTYLCLYDATWTLIDYDDDSAEDYNALIEAVLEAGETYYLTIDLYYSDESAEFVLVTAQSALEAFDEEVANEATIDGTGSSTVYTFTPTESGLYSFTVTGVGGYAGLFVYDAEWNELGEAYVGDYSYDYDYDYDYDIADGTTVAVAYSESDLVSDSDEDADVDVATLTVVLAEGETYYIELAYDSDDVPSSLSATVAEASAEALAVDETVSLSIDEAGDVAYYAFTPEESALYAFATSGDCDTYLTIYDATGAVIVEDDDGGSDYNASASAFLEAEQTYYLTVYLFDSDETGTFELSVTETAIDGEACVTYVAGATGLSTFALVGADGEDLTDELVIYDSAGALVDATDADGAVQVLTLAGETYYAVLSDAALEAGLEVEITAVDAAFAADEDAVAVTFDGAEAALVVDYVLVIEESGPVELTLAGTVEGSVQVVLAVCDETFEYAGYAYAVIEADEGDLTELTIAAGTAAVAGATYFVEVLVYSEEESAAADLVISLGTLEVVEIAVTDSDGITAQSAA